MSLFMNVRIPSVQGAFHVFPFPAPLSPLASILVPSVCILLHSFQSIVLTACDIPTVLKYMLQSKRFHRCRSTVEMFLPRTAEAIVIARCLLARAKDQNVELQG